MLYQHLLVRNGYEQTIMNGLKAKKKHTSMNTMFYQQKKKTYGILFSTKKEFFQKYASVCFYFYQGSPLACVGLEKVYEIFPWKSNDWLIAWLAAVLAY